MTNQILGKINFIYNKLSDERSKEAFADRLEYLLNNDEMIFLNRIEKENLEVKCPELDKYERENRNQKGYIIFGAGFEGKRTLKIVEKSKRRVIAWCDNNRSLWGTDIEGKTVLSPGELINEYKDVSVIITARNYFLQIYQQLVMMGFPRNNLIIPESGFLIGFVGCQYFDLFEAKEREVFVDAGCWNGSSTKEFVNWCRGEYKKVYAFEPDAACWSACEKMFQNENIQNVSLVKKGTWKEEAILYFDGTGRGSSNVSDKKVSSLQVPVTSIDAIAERDFPITFIKMDVEGSELQTLMGAKEIIKKDKPRLAVCVYHKPEDLWTLAEYILSLRPDYQLYLRHYTTCSYETVLYAV